MHCTCLSASTRRFSCLSPALNSPCPLPHHTSLNVGKCFAPTPPAPPTLPAISSSTPVIHVSRRRHFACFPQPEA
ncbi:hypothetical protein JZ751_014114 [Albula glossodonta]|uniref:Uncharacterized protein n=1 Tax=Albula glossodonta TaxID=121402 RepID=A0A8T2P0H6_9TELE|nr:hypothetical protein JZ751_014114 [Albula glossodonta]